MSVELEDMLGTIAAWRPKDTEFVVVTAADLAALAERIGGELGIEGITLTIDRGEPEYRCDNCDEWVTTYPRADSYVGDAWNAASPEGARCCDQCGMPVQEGNLRVA